MKDKIGKVLNVRLPEEGRPTFEFIGQWTGKDINMVSRLLAREYRLAQRTVRRGATKQEEVDGK